MSNNRDKLVESIDIVDEISSHIELEAKGRNYVGLCPFHADNNPSFTVSSEKGIYKCFVCGEGGDVVKFYRKFNHISNQAAIEALADKYNIKISNKQVNYNVPPGNLVLNDINKFYVTALHSTDSGKKAMQYLTNRGLTPEIIKHFHLGYGYEEGDKLFQYLERKIEVESNYNLSNIGEINHFTNKRDLFTSRITIPIIKNNIVFGFGGRALDSSNIKYLNSKDSRIFQKKEMLYHFDEALRLSPDKSIVVVEGFFDVIKAFQCNIKNAIALMGTAFTNNHIKQMKRLNIDTVYLGLDSDKAGQDATLKIGKTLLKNGFKVKILKYPVGKDLDEYLQSHDHSDFIQLQKNSINYKLYETEELIKNVSLLSMDEKDETINRIIDKLHVENDLVIEQVLSKLEDAFSVSRQYLTDKVESNKLLSNTAVNKNGESDYDQYQYDVPEMNGDFDQQNSQFEYYDQNITNVDVMSHEQPLVNNSNISFMSAQQLVIYRAIISKTNYIELSRFKRQYNKDLGIYEQLFKELEIYYSKFSKFDYVTFTNDNPKFALLINDLYEKEITENNISNQQLVEKVKARTSWGVFKR